MISKKNIIYFSTLFFLYRFLIIYFNFNELRVPEYSNLQLEALNNNFLETFWFYSSLPLGNFLIIKISSYFSHIMDLKYFFYILNSMYNFFSIILFSKILFKINIKKNIIIILIILISILMVPYETWQSGHHDHINILLFTLIAYYFLFLVNDNKLNLPLLTLVLLLLLLFNTLSIFFLIIIYIFVLYFSKKKILTLNLIFIFIFILNIGVHLKNKINFNLFAATSVSNLNLIQKTVHAIGIHKFQKLLQEEKKIDQAIKDCYKSIYYDNDWYPEGRDSILGQHFLSLCFFDHKNNKYDYDKIVNIPNFEDNKLLKKAIIDDEFIFKNKRWLTQFGYGENNLKTAIYFQSIGPRIFIRALLKHPFEMLIGKIGSKGFFLTIIKSLSWGSIFPLDYQSSKYSWLYYDKIISQLFRVFNIIGLSLCVYYVPKIVMDSVKRKKINKINIYYLLLFFISSVFITLISLITCCENPRHMVMIFFLIMIISLINYSKLIKDIKLR